MINKKEFYFPSADGITQIRALRWSSDKSQPEKKGILLLVHGMVEFIDRYDPFACFMAENGYVVYGHDLLGHGASVRSDDSSQKVDEKYWGYFGKNHYSEKGVSSRGDTDKGETEGRDTLIRDIRSLQSIALDEFPHLPCFLFGHSMGSLLARVFLCVYGSGLKAAVICGTVVQPAPVANAGMFLARNIAHRNGWFYRSPFLNKLVLGSNNKQFEPSRTSADWLTRDKSIVDRYVADRRNQFVFTCNGFYTLFSTLSYLTVRSNLERMPRDLPVLFISGAQDAVGSNGEAPKKTAVQFKSLGLKKTVCKIYPQCRHEILNELNKEEVFKDVLHFLDQA